MFLKHLTGTQPVGTVNETNSYADLKLVSISTTVVDTFLVFVTDDFEEETVLPLVTPFAKLFVEVNDLLVVLEADSIVVESSSTVEGSVDGIEILCD